MTVDQATPAREFSNPLLASASPPVWQGLSQETVDAIASLRSPRELVGLFPDFYGSEFVSQTMSQPRWTISNSEKVPIDFHAMRLEGRIYGAKYHDDFCLAPLAQVMSLVYKAANHAFRVQASHDGWFVLDIEKTCPDATAEALLTGLPWVYAERSMSGLGYHLVLPAPRNYYDWPHAATQVALKDRRGWYEVLADQFVTFTRQALPHGIKQHTHEERLERWDKVYADLAAVAKERDLDRVDVQVSTMRPELPYWETIVSDLAAMEPDVSLAEFYYDHSKLHFHLLGKYRRALARMEGAYAQLAAQEEVPFEMDDTARAWLMADALKASVPHRSKHDEARSGVPFLLRRAAWSLGATLS